MKCACFQTFCLRSIILAKMSVIQLPPLLFWAPIKEKKKLCHHGGGSGELVVVGGGVVKWEIWLVPRPAL